MDGHLNSLVNLALYAKSPLCEVDKLNKLPRRRHF